MEHHVGDEVLVLTLLFANTVAICEIIVGN